MGNGHIDIHHAEQMRSIRQFERNGSVRSTNQAEIQVPGTDSWECCNGREEIDKKFIGANSNKTMEYK